MSGPVRLTVVPSEGEADTICAMLRSEGIDCAHRTTNVSADAVIASWGWREVLVASADLDRARELMSAAEPLDAECVKCGRPIGEEGRWYSADADELHPYCATCAEREFGPL